MIRTFSERRLASDVQRLILHTDGVALCRFECPPTSVRWSRTNRIVDAHNLAFPRTWVEILPADGRPLVADPNRAMFYNYGDVFRRRLLAPEGDDGNVFLFDDRHVNAVFARYDPSVVEREGAPFLHRDGPVSPRLYLDQHRLMQDAVAGRIEPLEAVVRAFDVLDSAARHVCAARDGLRSRPIVADQRGHVEEIRRQLGLRVYEPVRLQALADAVGLSVFHMCRVFRKHMGLPIYRYYQRLRLRAVLDLVADRRRPLADVALDAGFSNQSHFTEAFRREYGQPPGRLRAAGSLG